MIIIIIIIIIFFFFERQAKRSTTPRQEVMKIKKPDARWRTGNERGAPANGDYCGDDNKMRAPTYGCFGKS
jgi:hypothetical protein